ncbi:MAG: metallophosphoesterase family protein [Jatrophihabitans sp.]
MPPLTLSLRRRSATGRGRPGLPGWPLSVLVAAGLVLVPLAAGVSAVAVAPPARITDVGLDGLNVQVSLQIGRNTTRIDSALLGGLRREGPSVLGKHLGLDIRPEDVDLRLFDSSGALDPATIDVAGHLFADRQARTDEQHGLQAKVIRHYAGLGLLAVYLVAMLEIFGYAYLKYRRRTRAELSQAERELVRTEQRLERRLAISLVTVTALCLLLAAGYVLSPLSSSSEQVSPDARLASTFLAGWQVTGPFSNLLGQAVTSIDSLSKSEQAFYDKVSANRDAAYARQFGTAEPAHDPRVIRLAILDDLQGTSGMARIVGEAAQQLHADAIVNLGDLTATGTEQEAYLSYLKSYTVEVLAHYAGRIPVYSSLGRHDTPAVAAYARRVHVTVADGTPQQIAGNRFIGVNSPYVVNFGDAAQLINPEITDDTVRTGLREAACAEQPLGVFAHDKELLDELTASGCVPIVIGGHDYTGQPPANVQTPNGTVRTVTLGSTGGHGAGDGFGGLSTPRNDAPFVMLDIDKATGAVTVDTTTVHPDASVTVVATSLAALPTDQLARLR